MPDEVPQRDFDWSIVANLQGDALLNSNANSDDRKGAELRRARLSATLDYKFDWRFTLSGDFAKYAGLRDAFVEYRGWPVFITAGQFVEPFGLLQASSSAASFMERPQSEALAPGYGLGLALNFADEHWGITGGVFSSTRNTLDFGGRRETSITGRITAAPVLTDDWVVHFGASASYRKAHEGFIQFVAIPETTLIDNLNAESALFYSVPEAENSDKYFLYGLEFAARAGPVLLMTEYRAIKLDNVFLADPFNDNFLTQESPSYHGIYVEGSWAVTGETRDYSVRHGTFGGLTRNDASGFRFGAIELAARYSNTDLHDDLAGGDKASVTSFGVNWLPIEYVKVMLEALKIHRDTGARVDDVNAVQARLQLYFPYP